MDQGGVMGAGAVDDGDAFERRTASGQADDRLDSGPHLLIAVRCGDHPQLRRAGELWPGAVSLEQVGLPVPAEPGERPQDAGVGIGDAREAGQHGDRGPVGQGAEEAGRALAELLRQEDDDAPETSGHGVLAGQLVGGRGHEVGFVVPLGQAGLHALVDGDDGGGLARRACKRGQRRRREVGQLLVGGHHRLLRGRVVAHPGEHPSVALQLLLHRDQEHRVRHRPAALGGEGGGAEQLGQPVGGDERDADQPCAAGRADGEQPHRRGSRARPP